MFVLFSSIFWPLAPECVFEITIRYKTQLHTVFLNFVCLFWNPIEKKTKQLYNLNVLCWMFHNFFWKLKIIYIIIIEPIHIQYFWTQPSLSLLCYGWKWLNNFWQIFCNTTNFMIINIIINHKFREKQWVFFWNENKI